jgi:hypothetical protein
MECGVNEKENCIRTPKGFNVKCKGEIMKRKKE